jgi:hypothetical protein
MTPETGETFESSSEASARQLHTAIRPPRTKAQRSLPEPSLTSSAPGSPPLMTPPMVVPTSPSPAAVAAGAALNDRGPTAASTAYSPW